METKEKREKFLSKAIVEGLKAYGTMKGWPDEVVLYQPHDTEQSLLYEFAECLCVRTLLHTQSLPVRTEFRSNSQFMSPSGEVPLLRVPSPTGEGELLVAGFDAIANLLTSKGLLNFDSQSSDEIADAAYARESFSTIETALFADLRLGVGFVCRALLTSTPGAQGAERSDWSGRQQGLARKTTTKRRTAKSVTLTSWITEYVSWCHEPTLHAVTLPRCGSVYSPPLNWLVPKLKQYRMQNRLKVLGIAEKSSSDIIKLMEECCEQLSLRLGDKKFFYSNESASLLDAVVFGHVFTILTTELPDIDLKSIVRRHKNLIDFCQRVEKEWFSRRRP